MKYLTAFILTIFLAFSTIPAVGAQAAGTIWMETNQPSYGAGENITITLKAASATPIQGFTFQLRYDPACLQPSTPTSLLSGLNYMAVPQTSGLVDAIFASTTPLNINGALAEVQFKALAACQTALKLENATLAVMDASGMAASLPGISLGVSSLEISVGGAETAVPQATSDPQANSTSIAGANPTSAISTASTASPEGGQTQSSPSASTAPFNTLLFLVAGIVGLVFVIGLIVLLWFLFRGQQSSKNSRKPAAKTPALFIKRGSQAGQTLLLVRFPCRIGSDPQNEIRLNDANISPAHAEIFADQTGYTLVDMGSQSGTYLNGRLIQDQQVRIKSGDVIRLGGVLLVFGPA